MLVLPGRSWTSCQKLDKKFHPFWVVSRPDPPTGVDLKVARAVVADMGGEIIVITVVAAAVVTAAAVAVAVVAAAAVAVAGIVEPAHPNPNLRARTTVRAFFCVCLQTGASVPISDACQ